MSDNLPADIPRAPDGQLGDVPEGGLDGQPGVQPMRDRDTSIEPDPTRDPAQVDWDLTNAADAGELDPDAETATGDDPAHLAADDDDVPREDLPSASLQPETQGLTPEDAELGDTGQGDLAPEDY
jgi:hypothetical protein